MKAHYDLCDYTKFWEGREYEDRAEKIALDKLLKQVTNKDSFVDIGGGYGRLTAYLAQIFKHGMLVDPSTRNIETAKDILEDFPNVEMMVGSLPRLDLKDDAFDLATLVRVSHHLVDIAPPIKELVRVVKPNGYVIIEIANKINMVARLKAYLRGDWQFGKRLTVLDRSSEASRKKNKIAFVNHHPREVLGLLEASGFVVVNILSVSNLRNPLLKRIIPLSVLLKVEDLLQAPLAVIYGGPSIFVLAKKATQHI